MFVLIVSNPYARAVCLHRLAALAPLLNRRSPFCFAPHLLLHVLLPFGLRLFRVYPLRQMRSGGRILEHCTVIGLDDVTSCLLEFGLNRIGKRQRGESIGDNARMNHVGRAFAQLFHGSKPQSEIDADARRAMRLAEALSKKEKAQEPLDKCLAKASTKDGAICRFYEENLRAAAGNVDAARREIDAVEASRRARKF